MDAQLKERAETLILGTGRRYGINANRDEVQRALNDPDHGPAFAQWAIVHLNGDNLLTPDEMATYTTLDKSGRVDKLAEQHDLAEVQAVTEDDIRIAIEELNRSTEAINKQTETLRQQQDAFSRLVKKASENTARRKDFELERQRKLNTERKYIAAQVEDLAQSVGFRVSDLEQQSEESGGYLNETVDEILTSDDKLLSSLQKLGWELDKQDPEEAQTIDKLREISARLIKTTVETLRAKLDRVYLESLMAAELSGDTGTASAEETKALEEELESLYSEIAPVAQMSAEQQYLEPASQLLGGHDGESLQRSAASFSYVIECLDYLIDRGDRMKHTLETFRSHQAASSSLIQTAKSELSVPEYRPRRNTKTTMPVSPVRSRANTRSRRRSSGIPEDPPIETLLENLAVTIPFEDEGNNKLKVDVLKNTLLERSAKEDDVALSLQESFEGTASSYLNDVKRAVQLLKDTVLAESPFGEITLVDAEIEGSISLLQNEVREIKENLERADAKKIAAKSEKKAEILKRWG